MTESVFPDNITREFNNTESDWKFIIPALRNGMTVTVTLKVAQLFKLSKVKIIRNGTVKEITFKKTEPGLWEMTLN
jgi:hypothetical protein